MSINTNAAGFRTEPQRSFQPFQPPILPRRRINSAGFGPFHTLLTAFVAARIALKAAQNTRKCAIFGAPVPNYCSVIIIPAIYIIKNHIFVQTNVSFSGNNIVKPYKVEKLIDAFTVVFPKPRLSVLRIARVHIRVNYVMNHHRYMLHRCSR